MCLSHLSVQSDKSTERVQAESQTGEILKLICFYKYQTFKTSPKLFVVAVHKDLFIYLFTYNNKYLL